MHNKKQTRMDETEGKETSKTPEKDGSVSKDTLTMEHSVLFEWNSVDSALNVPSMAHDKIKKICIFDFDNTLFKSPGPNPHLYSPELYRALLSPHVFSNGGWWSEPRFLGSLIDEFLDRSDEVDDSVYWNREMVDEARESWSHRGDGTLTILMTGRKELLFSGLLSKLAHEEVFGEPLHFHGAFLKRQGYATTMAYKCACLRSLLDYYSNAEEVVMYDDRRQQLEGFDVFFNEYREARGLSRGQGQGQGHSLKHTLVAVEPVIDYLAPAKEIATVADIFQEHNNDVDCKMQGLKGMIHGPICSLKFQMDHLTLTTEKTESPRQYLLDCRETHKLRLLVEKMGEDTKMVYPFSLPVVVACPESSQQQQEGPEQQIETPEQQHNHLSLPGPKIVTPDVSTDDFQELMAQPDRVFPHEPIEWSIHEALVLDSRKLAFTVTSAQKQGMHILFTCPYNDADIQDVKNTGMPPHINHSMPTFTAVAVPRYTYTSVPTTGPATNNSTTTTTTTNTTTYN